MTPHPRLSFFLLPLFLAAWAAVILSRLVHLQIVEYDALTRQARRQQERTVEVSPVRGSIYDRNLRPLAISVEVDSVFAVPAEVENPAATAKVLAKVLDLNARETAERLQGPRFFSWIKRKVTAQEAASVRGLNLQGIYFQKETKRFYPKRELAAHVLGHVGLDQNGLAGIELRYEKAIRGRPGQLLIEKDARQRWFGRSGRPPEPGANVVLTLDETIQHIAEKELETAMRELRPLAGIALVGDPYSGEILAMASRPTFNPNMYSDAHPEAVRNRAVSSAYEPGSTFKIVTLAAALEERLTQPAELIDCQNGMIVLAGHAIRDHQRFGILNVSEIFQNSSDVGAIKLALRLGDDNLYRYVQQFGFGSPSGIELPGESRGLSRPPERWSKISIGAIAMGQEIGTTPLQVLAAASVVANGGVWVRPRIVLDAGPSGDAAAADPGDARRVISPETAETMLQLMAQVVEKGTGKQARPLGYTAAGKTGTGQKIDPETGTYSAIDNVASFVGFVPAEAPVFAILVMLDSPRGKTHGGDAAAPVFRRIAEQVLAYRNVPATVPAPPPPAPGPSGNALRLAAQQTAPLEEEEEAAPLAPGAALPVLLRLESGLAVPNLIGMTVRDVAEQALARGFAVEVLGSGISFEQSPLPGMPLPEGKKVLVRFRVGSAGGARPPEKPDRKAPPPAAPQPAIAAELKPAAG